jgi:hypothetical protein
MNGSHRSLRIEARWPVALALLTVIVLLALLPGRIRPLPAWFPWLLGGVAIMPMVAVAATAGKPPWLRLERGAVWLVAGFTGGGTIPIVATLVVAMVRGSTSLTGLQLLTSSVAAWVNNVLAFSLIYWLIDRGGPEARANDSGVKPDWLFPQSGAEDAAPAGWRPTYVDYLFLAYSTATAFSTTEVAPMTSRAKLLMMLESTIALVIIVVVAARAINILGS